MNSTTVKIFLLVTIWLIVLGATMAMRSKWSNHGKTTLTNEGGRFPLLPLAILMFVFFLPLFHVWIQNLEVSSNLALSVAPLQGILLVLVSQRAIPRQLAFSMAVGGAVGYVVGVVTDGSVIGCSLVGWGGAAGLFSMIRVGRGLTVTMR